MVSGCQIPCPSGPEVSPNYIIHISNRTGMSLENGGLPLEIIENGYVVQHALAPMQIQTRGKSVINCSVDYVYTVIVWKLHPITGKKIAVGSVDIRIEASDPGWNKLEHRMFIIKFDDGENLVAEEVSSW